MHPREKSSSPVRRSRPSPHFQSRRQRYLNVRSTRRLRNSFGRGRFLPTARHCRLQCTRNRHRAASIGVGCSARLRPKPLDRFGVSMQTRQPNSLPDSEIAVSLTVATATEPPLTSSSISLARVESRAASLVVDAISSSPRSLPLERRPIPLKPLDRDSLPITDVNAAAKPIPVNPLLRSTVSPQLSTLIDEEPLTSTAPTPMR